MNLSPSQQRWARSKKTRGQYAIDRRVALVKLLSPEGVCALCTRTFPLIDLEIDHVDGAGWNKRSVSGWSRVARYWREYHAGIKLRALCRSCNGTLGAYMRRSSR